LKVRSCSCPTREEGGVSREESFGEEEECHDEGEGSADCTKPVVPTPSFCLSKKATNYELLDIWLR
jgi:hypothetical protein